MAFAAPLALAATAASAVMTGVAGYTSGQYQSQVARNNAQIMEDNSRYAIAKGFAGSEAQDLKTRGIVGAQKAAQAANGIDVNTGTAVKVRSGTEELGRLDALTIFNNAQREAFGFQSKKADYLAEAELSKMKGTNALASSLISGASGVSDKWLSYKQNGLM